MSNNPHALDTGGRDVTIATAASLDRLQAQPKWEMAACNAGGVDDNWGAMGTPSVCRQGSLGVFPARSVMALCRHRQSFTEEVRYE
ncbi:hypothetical protein LCGC14_2326430, partial [marine sediment metagenome]